MTIPSSNKVPGIYLELVFGVGPVSAADAPRVVAVVGNFLSTGTATADTPEAVTSEEDAKTYYGQGSELHRGIRAALRADPSAFLYGVPLTPPSGGTAATSTVTIAGTTASADGTITITCVGESIECTITSGLTPTTAGDALVAAIETMPDWPVSAANASGTVTVSARHKGLRGNQITFATSGTSTGLTWTHASGKLTGGLGSDTLTGAQAIMASQRYHLIAVPHDLSADIQSWRTHVNTAAGPTIGIRQQVVAASVDTLANAETLAISVNTARVQIVWHYNALDLTSEISAAVAARRAYLEGIDPAAPMSMQHGTSVEGLRVQTAIADQPTPTEVNSALNNGLTPIVADQSGIVYVARSITSRSQDTTGVPNYAVLDTAKVTVPDFFADTLQVNWPSFVAANPKLGPDPVGEDLPDPGVATPRSIRSWIYELEKGLEPDMLVEVDANLPNLIVTIPGSPAGRTTAKIPLDVVEGNYQLDASISQIG